MRYIQLEKGESIDTRQIIGFFDIDAASMSQGTLEIFRRKEEETGVVTVSNDLPKSFLLVDGEFTDTIYISGLSTESIRKRFESEKGMKTFWKK
jgi:hypothetical protein